jgi:hypothetical protein
LALSLCSSTPCGRCCSFNARQYAVQKLPIALSDAALEGPYHLLDGGAIEERFRHVVDAVHDHDFRVSASRASIPAQAGAHSRRLMQDTAEYRKGGATGA